MSGMRELGDRHRRGLSAATVGIGLVVLVGSAFALQGDGAAKQVSAEQPSTTEIHAVVVPPAQTVPTETTTTSTTAPTTAAPVPSTSRPKPTTTVPAPTSTTEPAGCTAADLAYYTKTDRASYPAGVSVTITIGAKNISKRRCGYFDGVCQSAQVGPDTGGPPIWDSHGVNEACPAPLRLGALDPGESRETSLTWDRRTCPTTTTTSNPPNSGPCGGADASPGSYRAYGNADPSPRDREGEGASVSPPFALQ